MAQHTVSLVRQLQCLRTIEAIVSCKNVHRYVIGYTAQGSWKRFNQYKNESCDHMVVVADALTYSQASLLEHQLQERVWSDQRSVLFRKYDGKRRDKKAIYSPYPVHMQQERHEQRIHCVYMAWWLKHGVPDNTPGALLARTGTEL